MSLLDIIRDEIHTIGPLTAARFIDLALYHPELGYYTRAGQRSGRGGDFFTSVDVGPLFGEVLAGQIAECFDLLREAKGSGAGDQGPCDLVEAGAGNGRLARDVLDALARDRPDLEMRLRLHLSERSPQARAAQADTLGPFSGRLVTNGVDLPQNISGVVYANELLDALPVHVVVMRSDGLREIFVDDRNGALVEVEGAPSTPALQRYLDRAGIALEPGGRAEINLAADQWITAAWHAIERGFLILIDYGHEAEELYSGSHATGTLTTFASHRLGIRSAEWLRDPGERDITSHVDLTSVRLAAEHAGFTPLGTTDQTYFLMGLGIVERIGPQKDTRPASRFSRTHQAKTLMLPGGLGSTHKVLIFSKGVGRPTLKGFSYRLRVT